MIELADMGEIVLLKVGVEDCVQNGLPLLLIESVDDVSAYQCDALSPHQLIEASDDHVWVGRDGILFEILQICQDLY